MQPGFEVATTVEKQPQRFQMLSEHHQQDASWLVANSEPNRQRVVFGCKRRIAAVRAGVVSLPFRYRDPRNIVHSLQYLSGCQAWHWLSLELKNTPEHLWHQKQGREALVKPSGRNVKNQVDQQMQELVALVESRDSKALVLIARRADHQFQPDDSDEHGDFVLL